MDFNSMQDNPQMMAMAQAMMSDPEVMMMMQQPGMMEKLQGAMANPASAMGDPDVMKIIMKLQSLGMGGGGGMGGGMGGMGGMGGFGAPSAAAAGGAGGDPFVHLTTEAELEKTLASAGSQLVVVDYYTNWCGPCKQIAPLFSELASAHKGKVVCVKVDGDRARDLVAAQGVQGFPTFHFYEKGNKIESFSGADSRRLRSIIEEHAAKADAPPPCPYRHFPLRDSEAAKYADIQWDKVEPKFREINGAADKMPADHPGKLSDAELAEVDALIATLKNKAAYHSSKVTAGQCAVVAKMLSLWPRDQLAAPLNLARIFVTHPSAAAQCAEASDKEVGGLSDVLTPLLRLASSVEKAVTSLLAIRTLCNCFARRVLARALLRRLEKVCESAAAAFRRHAADENLRLSVCALYINAAILLSESQDVASVEQEKVLLISAAQEALTDEPPNPKVVYRCAVVIGTLAYNDPTATQLARDLEIGHALANTAKTAQCKEDQTVQQVAEEIQLLLKEK